MAFVQVLFECPPDSRSMITKLESLNRKLTKAKTSLIFNQTCLIEKLPPFYSIMNKMRIDRIKWAKMKTK